MHSLESKTPTTLFSAGRTQHTATVTGKKLSLYAAEHKLLLLIVDLLIISAGFFAVLYLRQDIALRAGSMRIGLWLLTLSAIWIGYGSLLQLYELPVAARALRSSWLAGWAILLTSLTYFLIPYLTIDLPSRRLELLILPLVAIPAIMLWRFSYAHLFTQPALTRRALILGAGSAGRTMASTIASITDRRKREIPHLDYRLLGFIDDDKAKQNHHIAGLPVLGTRQDLDQIVQRLQPDEIIIAITNTQSIHPDLFRTLLALQATGLHLTPMPDLYEQFTGRIAVEHAGRDLRVVLPGQRAAPHRLYLLLFRAFELLIAAVGCLLMLLLIPPIWLVNRFTAPGPIFYRQERVGYRGRHFSVLKFRSMVLDAEKMTGPVWASEKDERITPAGRILRRAHLDEIPQFWNVLQGQMSLIGPRPERPPFVSRLAHEIPFYSVRHSVKPGITGWAQSNHPYGASVEDALTKLQYDLYYIKHRSPYLDLLILLKTVQVVVKLKGR